MKPMFTFPRLTKILADGGYRGNLAAFCKIMLNKFIG